DVRIKCGRYHNELTRYRYDVVLHKRPLTSLPLNDAPELGWGQQIRDVATLTDYLNAEHPQLMRITGIPNARITDEVALTRALQTGTSLTELRAQLRTPHT